MIPEETAGPFPGRRLERPRRPEPERGRPQRHPVELRLVDHGRRGRAADDPAHDPGRDERLRAARRRRRLRLALRPRRATTRCTRRPPRTRTTCAASRRPTTTGSSTFPSIFPACYSGRWPHIHFEVYPSLDDRDRRAEQDRDLADRPARRTSATRSTRPTATSQSVANLAQVIARRATMVFGDDGGVHQLGTDQRQPVIGLHGGAHSPCRGLRYRLVVSERSRVSRTRRPASRRSGTARRRRGGRSSGPSVVARGG